MSAPCPAAQRLHAWLDGGARGRLVLRRAEFGGSKYGVMPLLFCGPPSWRLRQCWRSFCAWMAQYTPSANWKTFWYRRAGASVARGAYISPGAMLDPLLPQLVSLDCCAVLGLDALVLAHLQMPDRIVLGRVSVKRAGLVGGRAILVAAAIGEEGVLGAGSFSMKSVPAGHIGVGVPAHMRKRKSPQWQAVS